MKKTKSTKVGSGKLPLKSASKPASKILAAKKGPSKPSKTVAVKAAKPAAKAGTQAAGKPASKAASTVAAKAAPKAAPKVDKSKAAKAKVVAKAPAAKAVKVDTKVLAKAATKAPLKGAKAPIAKAVAKPPVVKGAKPVAAKAPGLDKAAIATQAKAAKQAAKDAAAKAAEEKRAAAKEAKRADAEAKAEAKATAKAEARAAAAIPDEPDMAEDVVLTDAEGRRYCRVKDCDRLAEVDSHCRYHYILLWKNIQTRRHILQEGKLGRYIEELTARYPDKFLEILKKDLRSEKDFLGAIQELEIDESAVEAEFDDEESQSDLFEIQRVSDSGGGGARSEEDDRF